MPQPDHQHFPWGTMTWLASNAVGNARTLSVARMTILPGQQNSLHSHSNCEEVLVLIRGNVAHEIDSTTVPHTLGEAVVVPAGAAHRTRNVGSEPAELMVAYGAGEREYEEVHSSSQES